MPYPKIDLSRVRTYPLQRRANLVALKDMIGPDTPVAPFDNPDLTAVAERIVEARRAGRPVIVMFGGHIVKRALAPLLIEMMARGIVTHLASNGAATIHDFEIAMLGNTSEDVAASIEDGSFGMAEETGAFMNRAVRRGARDGLGMGEALGRYIAENEDFAFRQYSLLYNAYRLGIPYTVHVSIGTDIIHQHPECDFAALGWATGEDFKIYTAAVSQLEGGVFCNFGSAVTGPEVFLKALSISRNLGYTVSAITTANFDLLPLSGDYHRPSKDDQPEYYYRPKKNIIIRPTSMGGHGYHINGDHRDTLPTLYRLVRQGLPDPLPVAADAGTHEADPVEHLAATDPAAAPVLQHMVERFPALAPAAPAVAQAFRALSLCFRTGGTLFICGNGGSFADALHIAGELDKSYLLPRSLPAHHRRRLAALPGGAALAGELQSGLRTVVLGANPALASAVDNDSGSRYLPYAQELYALAHPHDVLLGISTSGKARNVLKAATAAHGLDMTVIGLTGAAGGPLAEVADVAVRAPSTATAEVQSWHEQIYHALCEMLERAFFGETDS